MKNLVFLLSLILLFLLGCENDVGDLNAELDNPLDAAQLECGLPALAFSPNQYDVAVGGYQFELFGITIVSATAPSEFFGNNSGNSMLGFSLSGATIPAGSAVLSTVTFSNYLGDTICFGTENSCAGASPNVISDSSGSPVIDGSGSTLSEFSGYRLAGA